MRVLDMMKKRAGRLYLTAAKPISLAFLTRIDICAVVLLGFGLKGTMTR